MNQGSDIKQSVQKAFGSVAANYATSTVHAGGADLNAMVECAHLSSDAIVLDAGCGAGHTALAFAPYVRQVVAYDLTPEMLEQVRQLAAQREIHNLITQQGDVEKLPFEERLFEAVVSRYSAHHWPHPQAALHEFARVLKSGGQFILGDVVAAEDPTQDTWLQAIELLRDPSHVRDYSVSQWLNMMREAGFEAELIMRHDIKLTFQSWVARINTSPLYVQALRSLFAEAPTEIRKDFALADHISPTDDFSFVIPGAVIRAKLDS